MPEKFKFYAFKLAGLMIFIFLIQLFFQGFTEFFLLNSSVWNGEYWRFFTPIFLHGSVAHLFYNLLALVLFGSILERVLTGRKFLMIFFVTGVLANLVSVNFYPSSLGASGAIFGIIGAIVILRPFMPIWAFGLPMPMFVAGFLWAAGDVIGIFNPSNVANIAHLSGMFFGLFFGFIFRKKKRRKISKHKVPEKQVRNWERSWH